MIQKWRKEKPVNPGRVLKPSPGQGNGFDLPEINGGQIAETTPVALGAYLIEGFQQAQQRDSVVWAQEHIGNSIIKDMQTGGGTTLGHQIQAEMGSAFDRDFSNVRIHNNESTDRAAESLHAKAFTIVNDIYFRRGEYDSGTAQGKELLSHELAHVAQQDGASRTDPVSIARPGSEAELQAEWAARSILKGDSAIITARPEMSGVIARYIDPRNNPAEQHRNHEERDAEARSRSQLYSEFSREVLHRIRISREAVGAEPPDYRIAAVHIDNVYGYCQEILQRSESSLTYERRPHVESETESGFFRPNPSAAEALAELPLWPVSLLPGLRDFTEAAYRLSTYLTDMVFPPGAEASEEAGADLETIVTEVTTPPPEQISDEEANSDIHIMFDLLNQQALELWQGIQTQP